MATVKADEGSDLDSGGSAGGCGSYVDNVLMSIFEYHYEHKHIKNRMKLCILGLQKSKSNPYFPILRLCLFTSTCTCKVPHVQTVHHVDHL